MRTRRIGAGVAFLLAAVATVPAQGQIYRWTDAEGRVHFSGDLSQVPADQRGAAKQGAEAAATAPSRVQTYESKPAASAASALRADSGRVGRVHRVRVERAGNGMVVPVRLNGHTVAPFLIDTGASYVLVPKHVADAAGIVIGPDTRTLRFGTANGIVEQPVLTLDSVELGTARAEQVPAAISDRMDVGLLGLSFFNRFTYQVDAAAGVVTLVENELAESGQILGGRGESQWRGEFEALRMRIAEIDAARALTPPSRSRRLERLDEEQRAIERQIESLDAEADQAKVPQGWRH
jgi:clan AA aspartic protease (TIGR02281 family)